MFRIAHSPFFALVLTYAMVGVMIGWAVMLPVGGVAHAQDLTQRFITTDGTLAFTYPDAWIAQETFGSVMVANGPDVLETMESAGELLPGQAALMLLSPVSTSEQMHMFDLEIGEDPVLLAEAYLEALGEIDAVVTPITIDGHPAAEGTTRINGERALLYMISFGEDGMLLAALATAPGETGVFRPAAEAILASAVVTPLPDLDEIGQVVWRQLRPIAPDAGLSGGYGDTGPVVSGPDDTIFVLDTLVGIHMFAADGAELGTVPLVSFLVDFDVDLDGTLWGITLDNEVLHFDTSGAVLGTFALPEGSTGVNARITVGPEGDLYVLSSAYDDETELENGVMTVYDPQGQVQRSFIVGSAEFFYRASYAFGQDGHLYLASPYGSHVGITAFDTSGRFIKTALGSEALTYGADTLALAPDGTIYAGSVFSGAIYHLDEDGTLLGRFGEPQFRLTDVDPAQADFPPFEPGQFYSVTGLATLSNGDVIAADFNRDYLQIIRIAFEPVG